MKKIKIFPGFIFIFLLSVWAYPEYCFGQSDGEYGTTMNISYGAGARAMGLGRAYVAVANDPTAVFWNPAGLELVPKTTLTLFHNQLFEGTAYDFIGFVYPTLTYGTVGLGFARLGTDDIPFVDSFGFFDPSRILSYQENEFYVSYGKKFPRNIYGGFTFKIRRQAFSGTDFSPDATGLGIDIGFMYHPEWEGGIFSNLGFGLSYRNFISPTLRLGVDSEEEPYHMTFGLVKGLRVGERNRVNVVLDFHKSKLEGLSLLAGTEYIFREMGTIRLGFDNSSLAFGAGIQYSFVKIDYSFGSTMSDGEFPPTHRFSITFDVGKSREDLFLQAEKDRLEREKELVARTKEEERQNLIVESLKNGRQYLQEKRYFDAYSEFQQVVTVDPFNNEANALMDSANALIQQELDQRQQTAISSALDKERAEEDRRFVKIHFEKGQLYLGRNQYTDALVEFNLALERSPNDPIIKEAIETGQRRMQAEVRKLVTQGREEFRNGNYSNALLILNRALVLAPEDPKLKQEINTLASRIKIQQYVQQALQYLDRGEYQSALSLFEEALKMDPSNQRLREYVERTKQGMGIGEQLMDQESERRYIEAVDLFLAGKYEEALAIWKELQKKYPYIKKLQDAVKSAEDRLNTR